MSVLINMEMPTSCRECQIRNGVFCPVSNGLAAKEGKRCDCPIIPVPPHGRLIDADALMQHEVFLPMDGGHLPVVYASYVRHTPTIIPAEEATQKDEGQDETQVGPYDLLYEEGGYNSNGV